MFKMFLFGRKGSPTAIASKGRGPKMDPSLIPKRIKDFLFKKKRKIIPFQRATRVTIVSRKKATRKKIWNRYQTSRLPQKNSNSICSSATLER